MTVPGRSWRLTELGVQQAKLAEAWIEQQNIDFDRAGVSAYTRARKTAAMLRNVLSTLHHENPRENVLVVTQANSCVGNSPDAGAL